MTKFNENRARDDRAMTELARLAFAPVVIWECEAADSEKLAAVVGALEKLSGRTRLPKLSGHPGIRSIRR